MLSNVSENESYLCHCRFDHLSCQGLMTLFYKKMVNGIPFIQIPKKLCTECLIDKQHKDYLSKRSLWRASNKLQLVHADICGSIKQNQIAAKGTSSVL
jgi:hypothetical protein